MYVDTVKSRRTAKDGSTREYSSVLLRRSVRDGTKVGKQTLANLTALPEAAVEAVRSVLAGRTLVEAEAALTVTRSLPHGHVALVLAQARKLGLVDLLGPPGRAAGSHAGVGRVPRWCARPRNWPLWTGGRT